MNPAFKIFEVQAAAFRKPNRNVCSLFSFHNVSLCSLQMFISSVNLIANLYCLVAFLVVDSLRRNDFYFVFVQTLMDFLVSGLYNIIFGLYQLQYSLEKYCFQQEWIESQRAVLFPNGRWVNYQFRESNQIQLFMGLTDRFLEDFLANFGQFFLKLNFLIFCMHAVWRDRKVIMEIIFFGNFMFHASSTEATKSLRDSEKNTFHLEKK